MDKTARVLGAHALGTFHHEQKKSHGSQESMVQAVAKTSHVGPFDKIGRTDCYSCGGRYFLFGCEVRGFSNKEEREYEALWSRVVFGFTRQKRGDLEQDRKTLADLRIACKMKPILDLVRIRQLNYLASLARLPDDRLKKIVLRGHLIPEHAVGVSKAAPKNTVRKQYKKNSSCLYHILRLTNFVRIGSKIGKNLR